MMVCSVCNKDVCNHPKNVHPEYENVVTNSHSGCPCVYTTPCDPMCTCANPLYSRGCERCCTYGSLEQRKASAERLAHDLKLSNLDESEANAEYIEILSECLGDLRDALWEEYPNAQNGMIGSPEEVIACAIDFIKNHKNGN